MESQESTKPRAVSADIFDVILDVFLKKFLEVLEVLERSGRLKGRVSTNFRQKRSGGLRAMTKKPKILTT